jgi:DNA (cytosine-5)-methyltransferase 1
MKKLKLLDTFSGIGGFSYAAEKLVGGFETTQFIEIDPYCQKVLKKHWPNVPIHDDIRTFTAKPFQYDAVCGGFPCQDISVAGGRKGITEKSRSGLFYELMRVIRLVRPKFVIMENVAAILNNGLDIVLGELSQAGYDAEWSIISASSLGACHRRSRWWLVAYPNGFRCGGRSSERCSIQERQILSGEQKGSEMGGETERCSSLFTDTNNNGSPRTTESRSIKKTNGGTEKRKNETCQSQGGSESKNTKAIQLNVTNPDSNRLQGKIGSRLHRATWRTQGIRRINPSWRQYESQPCLCRGDDGLSNRVDRLKALGNSVVPQVAAIPLQRVKDIHKQLTTVDR